MAWDSAKLKRLRVNYGENQDTFCRRLGVKVQTLRDWEQYRSPNPTACLLLDRLARELSEGTVWPLPKAFRAARQEAVPA